MKTHDNSSRRAANHRYYVNKVKPKRERELGKGGERLLLVTMRLPASVVGRVTRILHEGIATGAFPYKTASETYRDLIVRGMETLKGSDVADEAVQYLRAVSVIEGISHHRIEAQAAFSRVKTELSELLHIKSPDAAAHYFWSTFEIFQKMDQNVWRDWLLDSMQSAFPELVKTKLSPISLDDEDPYAKVQPPHDKPKRKNGLANGVKH